MFMMTYKLKVLKQELRFWNKEIFGDVYIRVQEARHKLEDIQLSIALNDVTEDNLSLEAEAKLEVLNVVNYQIWCNRAETK